MTERLPIQRKGAEAAPEDLDPTAAPSGGGALLPEGVRGKMERGFGADFGDVRVHVDDRAEQIGATAYTRGNDIHFAPGTYDPEGPAGQALLGHELTHVVQQRAGRAHAPLGLMGKGAPINADPALEAEADDLGARVAAGQTVAGAGAAGAAAGVVQRSQRDNAKIPTQAEQNEMAGCLDPGLRETGSVGVSSTPWDKDEKTLASELFDALTNYLQSRGSEIDGKKHSKRVPMGASSTDGGVLQIVAAVQRVIEAEYGAWVKGSIRTTGQLAQLSTPPTVVDASDETERLKLIGKSGKHYEVAMNTGFWIINNDGGARAVMKNHHFSPRRTAEESDAIDTILDAYVRHGSNGPALFDLMLYGMNEHGHDGIALSTAIDPAAHGKNAERHQRWVIFQKALHELMHGLAHPGFLAAARDRAVMLEGFCEFIAAALGAAVMGNVKSGKAEPLRRAVEGSIPLDPSGIPDYVTPSDYAPYMPEVNRIVQLAGPDGVLAAYFQGHVEFLGLAPNGGQGTELTHDDGKARVRVPEGITSIAALAQASGLGTDAIQSENPSLGEPLVPGTPLILPGCREHMVTTADDGTTTETRAHIAAQQGVTEESLARANPAIPLGMGNAWPHLPTGHRVFIPAA